MPDDNTAALCMLLYIIHGQPEKAPEKASLTTLTHVAILVGKYELHEGQRLLQMRGPTKWKGRA